MKTLTQKIIAALYRISESSGIWLGDEPLLIEHLIETIGMPMTGESYVAVRERLFTSAMSPALKKLSVEFNFVDMPQQAPVVKLGPGVRWWNGRELENERK